MKNGDLYGRNNLLTSESYRVSDITAMLNGNDPKNKPRVVYKRDLAQKELGVMFKPAKQTLVNYAK